MRFSSVLADARDFARTLKAMLLAPYYLRQSQEMAATDLLRDNERLRRELDRAWLECGRLRGALENWTEHLADCELDSDGSDECACGLDHAHKVLEDTRS